MGGYTQDNRVGKLTTDLGKDKLLILGMTATERLSESYTVTIDAMSEDQQPLHNLLGTAVGVVFEHAHAPEELTRDFAGILWEYSELGKDDRGYIYRLVLRPQTELMTLNRRNRIFQKKSVVDIVKSVLVGTPQYDLNGSYEPLEYCVQYQESDFEFFSRLLETDGIYYYYKHEGTTSKIVLLDERNSHPGMTPAEVQVMPQADRRPDAPIWSVTERRGLGPAKVSVSDYDFQIPSSSLLRSKAAAKTLGEPTKRNKSGGIGSAAWDASAEVFHYPGKVIVGTEQAADTQKGFTESARYTGLWLDSHRRKMARSFAEGALFSAAVGRTVTLKFENDTQTEYLIVATEHFYTAPPYDSGEGEETFLCSLELMPASEQYRPALVTPRPRVLGPQTAIVTGPAGEEIYTDKYGRIKVQFYWDREGKQDDNSSCFIRVMQATAGQSWGSFHLPRIGQEVVITFMDGDPDRPLVTGAVYNANNMLPVDLPANKTQFGLRTRITKGGGGFSHYWFEDKKGEEVVWFRAERDYKAHIVHADEERQYDEGSRQTTFLKGNDVLKINSGYRAETIEGNDSKTILSGDLTDIVKKGDEVHTVEKGKRTTEIYDDEAIEVKMGNRAAKISMGNESLKVAMGNIDVKADLGKITMEAMQSIELKVGGSSIKIDQIGVTIKGTVMVDIKGVMIQSSADAMQTIKGGLVMIN